MRSAIGVPMRRNFFAVLSLIAAAISILLPLSAASPGGPWKRRRDSPEARVYQVAAAVNGKIYLISSGEDDGPGCDVLEYDPAADSYTKKKSCHIPRNGLSAAAVGEKIYIWGGIAGEKGKEQMQGSVEVYDPVADTWSVRQNLMPEPAQYDVSAVLDGKVYSIRSTSVWEYDPATDRWTARKAPPVPQAASRAAALGGKIYIVGGHNEAGRLVHAYDPTSNTWSRVADIPTARADFTLIALEGQLYAIGGANFSLSKDKILRSVETYDPQSNRWTARSPLPEPHWEEVSAVLDGRIYLFEGGWEPHCKASYEYTMAAESF